MARIRSIKPEYWKDEKLAGLLPGPDGRQARLLFVALWNFSEDQGVIRAHPSYLRGEIFPYDEDVGPAEIIRWLDLLEAANLVVRYQRDGQAYLWIRHFTRHQRIDKPSKGSLPEPSEDERNQTFVEPSRALHEASRVDPPPLARAPVGSGVEGNGDRSGVDAREGSTKPRKNSWQQDLFTEFQKSREERLRSLDPDGPPPPPDKQFTPAHINAVLKEIREAAGISPPDLVDVFDLFLGEAWPAKYDPPYTFQVFASEKTWRPLLARLPHGEAA